MSDLAALRQAQELARKTASKVDKLYGPLIHSASQLKHDADLEEKGFELWYIADTNLIREYFFPVTDRRPNLEEFTTAQVRCWTFFSGKNTILLVPPYYRELMAMLSAHFLQESFVDSIDLEPDVYAASILESYPLISDLVGTKLFRDKDISITQRIINLFIKEITEGEERFRSAMKDGGLSMLAEMLTGISIDPHIQKSAHYDVAFVSLTKKKPTTKLNNQRDAEAYAYARLAGSQLRDAGRKVVICIASEDKSLLSTLEESALRFDLGSEYESSGDTAIGRGVEYFLLKDALSRRKTGSLKENTDSFLRQVELYRTCLHRLRIDELRTQMTGDEPDGDAINAYLVAYRQLKDAIDRIQRSPLMSPDGRNIHNWVAGLKKGGIQNVYSEDENKVIADDISRTSEELRKDLRLFATRLRGFVSNIERLTAKVVLPPTRKFRGLEFEVVWSEDITPEVKGKAEKAIELMKSESLGRRMEAVELVISLWDQFPNNADVVVTYVKTLRMMHLYEEALAFLQSRLDNGYIKDSPELQFQEVLCLKQLATRGSTVDTDGVLKALSIVEELSDRRPNDPRFSKERGFLNWLMVESNPGALQGDEDILRRAGEAVSHVEAAIEMMETGVACRSISKKEKDVLTAACQNDLVLCQYDNIG